MQANTGAGDSVRARPYGRGMAAARLLLRHPLLVALLLACALASRVAVPAGFMPVAGAGGTTLQPCPGTMPAPIAMADMHHTGAHQGGVHQGGAHHGDRDDAPAKAEQPCAFAGLALPALGSADPVLLAAALAFAFLLAVTGACLVPGGPTARLRPPLRAPPLPD